MKDVPLMQICMHHASYIMHHLFMIKKRFKYFIISNCKDFFKMGMCRYVCTFPNKWKRAFLVKKEIISIFKMCFVEIVTTSQSINELNYFPNCDTLQARQPFGNYSVLLYLYFTVIIFLIRLLCVTYRFRTTLTKNKQQFETHGFGCVSQQNKM